MEENFVFTLVLSGSVGGGVVVGMAALFFRSIKDKLAESWKLEEWKDNVQANSLQVASLNQLLDKTATAAQEALTVARATAERQDHQWAQVAATVIEPLTGLTKRLEKVVEIQERHGRDLAVLLDRDRRDRRSGDK